MAAEIKDEGTKDIALFLSIKQIGSPMKNRWPLESWLILFWKICDGPGIFESDFVDFGNRPMELHLLPSNEELLTGFNEHYTKAIAVLEKAADGPWKIW